MWMLCAVVCFVREFRFVLLVIERPDSSTESPLQSGSRFAWRCSLTERTCALTITRESAYSGRARVSKQMTERWTRGRVRERKSEREKERERERESEEGSETKHYRTVPARNSGATLCLSIRVVRFLRSLRERQPMRFSAGWRAWNVSVHCRRDVKCHESVFPKCQVHQPRASCIFSLSTLFGFLSTTSTEFVVLISSKC